MRYKKPHAKLALGNAAIFVALCLGVKHDEVDKRLTQRHQATKEDLFDKPGKSCSAGVSPASGSPPEYKNAGETPA